MQLWNRQDSGSNYWKIFVSAALWTIWIVKNGCTFQNERKNSSELEFMLKHAAYRWIKSQGWIQKVTIGLENIWLHSPINFLKIQSINRKDELLKILYHNYDLIGFTDGSWSNLVHGGKKGGIGGVLCNKLNDSLTTTTALYEITIH